MLSTSTPKKISQNYDFMSVAYLKVTHGLCFNVFFYLLIFFLGAGFLMFFHGHGLKGMTIINNITIIMIISIQPRHILFYFVVVEQLGWCPPRSLCPTQTV